MRCAVRAAGRATWPRWPAPWAAPCVLVLLALLALLAGDASCSNAPAPSSSSAPPAGRGPDGASESRDGGDEARRFSDAFFQCYAPSSQQGRGDAAEATSALTCVGEGARVGLESFFTRRDVHVAEGLTLEGPSAGESGAPASREVPADGAPWPWPAAGADGADGQHRSVIDSAAAYLSARSLRWDMSGLYPGLVMRVGPTLSGSGWLEFVLEPRRIYNNRELGPSRVLLKQVVLPFLLGLKVSVASLVPLLLFAIVFLAKKALLMSQLSALVSGLLGFGAYGAPYGHPHAFGGGLGGLDGGGPGLGPGLGHGLNNPLLPVRSPQVFPQHPQRQPIPVEEPNALHGGPVGTGPQILHVGGGGLGGLGVLGSGHPPGPGPAGALPGLGPSWLTGSTQHLFRKVNYDFRDERHASSGATSATPSATTTRNTKGFRWEDEPRAADARRSGSSPNALWSPAGSSASRG